MRSKIFLILTFIFTFFISSYTGSVTELKLNSQNSACQISDNDCPVCHGSGIIVCDHCNGKGLIDCPDCKGEGDIKVKCSFCNGNKNVNGKICTSCLGNGYLMQNCRSCDGKGAFRCSRCNYRGVIPCTHCQGIGEVSAN